VIGIPASQSYVAQPGLTSQAEEAGQWLGRRDSTAGDLLLWSSGRDKRSSKVRNRQHFLVTGTLDRPWKSQRLILIFLLVFEVQRTKIFIHEESTRFPPSVF
jgi:hypothetical protein